MYVAIVGGSYVHTLIPLARHDFENVSKLPLRGTPVYYYTYADKLAVWPSPELGTTVCRLEQVQL